MHYEINVSENGQHLFATHKRSLSTPKQAKKVFDRLKIAFPESEGFDISMSREETVGRGIDVTPDGWKKLLKEYYG